MKTINVTYNGKFFMTTQDLTDEEVVQLLQVAQLEAQRRLVLANTLGKPLKADE